MVVAADDIVAGVAGLDRRCRGSCWVVRSAGAAAIGEAALAGAREAIQVADLEASAVLVAE